MRRILGLCVLCRGGACDAVAVGVSLALLIALTQSAPVREAISLGHATVVMALLTVTAGGMAAILAHVTSRLLADRRAAWLGVALVLYSLAVIPAATIDTRFGSAESAIGVARLFAQTVVVALLVLVVWGARIPGQLRGWWLSAAGLLLTAGIAALASEFPDLAQQVISFEFPQIALAIAGPVVGIVIVLVGWVQRSAMLSRIGLGATVLLLVPLRGEGPPDGPIAEVGLTQSSAHLFGILLVLITLFQTVRRVLGLVDSTQAEQEEELRLAKLGLSHAAERDHELRNGLAGLAGAANVFKTRPLGADTQVLSTAVAAELDRLNVLLAGPNPGASTDNDFDNDIDNDIDNGAYAVLPVLRQHVVLWRSGGMDIRLDAELGLFAHGSPSSLAQVFTNVLTNCAKHASGSPVRIQASRAGDTIRIRVSDFGAGIERGIEQAVLERGVRGAHSNGHGLGLHICQRLLQADGGRLFIRPRRAHEPGCTVFVELPAAASLLAQLEPAALLDTS